jgi:hypothetical protein
MTTAKVWRGDAVVAITRSLSGAAAVTRGLRRLAQAVLGRTVAGRDLRRSDSIGFVGMHAANNPEGISYAHSA